MRSALNSIRWRWLAAGVLLGLAVGIAVMYGLPDAQADTADRQQDLAQQLGTLEEGSQAPQFELQSVAGETIALSQYRGQVVVLNFWATWCGPCRLEMPVLQSRFERYSPQGFIVLGINAGEGSDPITAFRDELGLSFPLLLDPQEDVQRLYRIRAYPTSILIDRQGKIAKVHFGIMTEEQLDEYLSELGVGS